MKIVLKRSVMSIFAALCLPLTVSCDTNQGGSTPIERSEAPSPTSLAEENAVDYLQRIDPCGFVDEDSLRKSDFQFTHYGYRASGAIGQYNSCQISTASGATVTLLIDSETPYRDADDTYLASGMTFKKIGDSSSGSAFAYVGYLGLDTVADAPGGEPERGYLKNMRITVMASTPDDTRAMELAKFVTDMVAKVRQRGVPKITDAKAKAMKGFDVDPCSFAKIFSRHGFGEVSEGSPYPHYCRYNTSDKKSWITLEFHPVDTHDRRWAEMVKKTTPSGEIYVDEKGPGHQVVILLGNSYELSYLDPLTEGKLSQIPALSVRGGASLDVNTDVAQEVVKSLPS
ncbi:hypothetical protein [Mycobacteroides abscessus]|uniref:hypothetical protein n=1 Tax=Mycobacteroides abscessus TaxID=36809 RepID=UPI001055C6FB|nr:hypothetical protein [Mycobacteroides abscessus]